MSCSLSITPVMTTQRLPWVSSFQGPSGAVGSASSSLRLFLGVGIGGCRRRAFFRFSSSASRRFLSSGFSAGSGLRRPSVPLVRPVRPCSWPSSPGVDDPLALVVEGVDQDAAPAGEGGQLGRRDQLGLVADQAGARLGGDPVELGPVVVGLEGVGELVLDDLLEVRARSGRPSRAWRGCPGSGCCLLRFDSRRWSAGGSSSSGFISRVGLMIARRGEDDEEGGRQADHGLLAVADPEGLELFDRRVAMVGGPLPSKLSARGGRRARPSIDLMGCRECCDQGLGGSGLRRLGLGGVRPWEPRPWGPRPWGVGLRGFGLAGVGLGSLGRLRGGRPLGGFGLGGSGVGGWRAGRLGSAGGRASGAGGVGVRGRREAGARAGAAGRGRSGPGRRRSPRPCCNTGRSSWPSPLALAAASFSFFASFRLLRVVLAADVDAFRRPSEPHRRPCPAAARLDVRCRHHRRHRRIPACGYYSCRRPSSALVRPSGPHRRPIHARPSPSAHVERRLARRRPA